MMTARPTTAMRCGTWSKVTVRPSASVTLKPAGLGAAVGAAIGAAVGATVAAGPAQAVKTAASVSASIKRNV
jgi:hypothetical protein